MYLYQFLKYKIYKKIWIKLKCKKSKNSCLKKFHRDKKFYPSVKNNQGL